MPSYVQIVSLRLTVAAVILCKEKSGLYISFIYVHKYVNIHNTLNYLT